MYTRVKDIKTRHEFDILKKQFNPEKHVLVTKGKYAGESTRARPPKLNVKRRREAPLGTESGTPSGDNIEREETEE